MVWSNLEFERALLHIYNGNVASYTPQKPKVRLRYQGRWVKTTFDFCVRYRSGEIVYEECKYESELRDPENRAHRQIAIQRAWCESAGIRHQVVTERDVWRNPTLINSMRVLIADYSPNFHERMKFAGTALEPFAEQIRCRPGLTLRDLAFEEPLRICEHHRRLALAVLIMDGRVDARIDTEVYCDHTRLFPGGVENE